MWLKLTGHLYNIKLINSDNIVSVQPHQDGCVLFDLNENAFECKESLEQIEQLLCGHK